ncbi:unnamed protein product [Symbiodinium sp. CCMP2592]|nr:unnamed protein product [Symbiodinium sp. CCMP2592]
MTGYPSLEEQALEMAMAGVGRDEKDDASSSSEGEETGGSDASDTADEDVEKKSRDGGDRDRDDNPDPPSGAGASSSAEPSPSVPETFMDYTKEAFEKHIQSILADATTKEDYIKLRDMLKDYTTLFFNGYKSANGMLKKMVREEKKKALMKQKTDMPNIETTIKFQSGGKTVVVSLPAKGTLRTLRNVLTSLHGYKDSHLKKCRFMLNNLDDGIDMAEHPRREMVKWCPTKSSMTVTVIFGGSGGGKRAASSLASSKNLDEKKKDLYEDLGMMAMRVANTTIPSVTECVKVLMNLKQNMDKGEKTIVTSVFSQMSANDLMEIQNKLASTGNTQHKIQHIAKVAFGKMSTEMFEMKKQSETMDKATILMTHLMLLHEFGNDDSSIGWSAFTSALTGILVKKASDTDASDAPTTGLTA